MKISITKSVFSKSRFAVVVLASLFSFGVAQAAIVDFEGDSPGAKANGFVSGGVTFNDSNGSGLRVYNNLPTECAFNGNHCLANFGVDTGLRMSFGGLANSLSLDFGNDQSDFIPADGLALLRLFLGNVQVGEASTVVNLDDIMNQSVAYVGATFDNATFTYTDGSKNAVGLIEIVDNINYQMAVPEPGSMALLGLGLAGLAGLRRRKA